MKRTLSRAAAAILLAAGLAGCNGGPSPTTPPSERQPSPASHSHTLPPVESLGVLGDSISLGVNACDHIGPCPEQAWAGGDSPWSDSISRRLAAATGQHPRVLLAAKDGGGVDDAVERVTTLAAEKPDFVTILVGANDACASQASQMMSTTEFREKFATLLEELTATSPETVVLAMSIPDFKHVWELGKENPTAIRLWSEFYGCRNLLRDPTSTAPEAERSRQAVFQRVIDFNGIIEEECETFDRCMTDNNDLFRHKFTVDEISDIDFFHPSAEGQRTIAEIAWKALTREVIL